MRVLAFGTYDTTMHPRVGVLIDGLRANGVDVVECNAPLGFDTAERVNMLAKPWRAPLLLVRLAQRWTGLARRVRELPAPDVVLVGYLGHFDVHLARLCLPGVPIALDHLIGASDTAKDRRLNGGLRQRVLETIDAAALSRASAIIVDTEEHLAALPDRHRARGVVVPVGAPTAWLSAQAGTPPARPAPAQASGGQGTAARAEQTPATPAPAVMVDHATSADPDMANARTVPLPDRPTVAAYAQPTERQQPTEHRQPTQHDQPTERQQPTEHDQPTERDQPTAYEQLSEPAQPIGPGQRAEGGPTTGYEGAPGDGDETVRPLRVVFFGLYTPLQGAPVIAEALARLVDAPVSVSVTMVGHGQDLARARELAAGNTAVSWLDWVDPADIPALVASHDVCLGIFGTGAKALRVVPNKVFQGAAAGCAIVTADTAPQRRALGDAAVYVPPGDGAALATALLRLAGDPAELARLRKAATELAHREFAPARVVVPLLERLSARLDRWPTRARLTAAGDSDRVAPLTPNAWLRLDAINRMMPGGVTDVLEVGCGEGALGFRLARRYRYLGLEPDPASYAVAARRLELAGRGSVRNERVESLGDERFDLVCAFEVLEHIEDDAGALAAWAGRLRRDGWLLLSVPAHQRRYGAADELVGHFRRYDPDGLAALLRRAGFTEIDMRQYGMPLGYPLEAARNAIGRRRLAAAKTTSVEERTAASGRLLQPKSGLRGALTRWGTGPFRLVQRAFPGHGTGLIVRARLAGPERSPETNADRSPA